MESNVAFGVASDSLYSFRFVDGFDRWRAVPASVHRCTMPVAVGFRMRLLPIVGGLCCCFAALGQTESGSIAGSVFDPAHAPAAGMSVEARNTETGTDYKAVSSAKGEYTLAQLPPGRYDIFVIDAKYRPFVRRGVVIRAGHPAALEIQLASNVGIGHTRRNG